MKGMACLKELTNLYDAREKNRRGIIESSLHLKQMLLWTEMEEDHARSMCMP